VDMEQYIEKTRKRLLSAGIDLAVVIGGAEPCEQCQAMMDGGPYSLSGTDSAHMSWDAARKAYPHFGAADCRCALGADTSELDAIED